MERLKVAIETLGCRVNIYDSEAMVELFKADGYEAVSFSEVADVYVINTCTVTNMGDRKSRQMIKRAVKLNPKAIVCVVGCYAQVAKEEIEAIPEVSVILGSRNKNRIVEFANRSRISGERMVEVTEVLKDRKFEDLKINGFENHSRAFLKIQDGCNRFCSYCMIPYARGGIASKDREIVLREIRSLKEKGFKEIILTGIHIASYGVDTIKVDNEENKIKGQELFIKKEDTVKDKSQDTSGNYYSLIDLLEDIDTIKGIERVRIGSIEPMFFNDRGIERIRNLKKLCPHFHLSLQSGSASVLKRMNRRYSPSEYEEAVKKLRTIENVSITTDVIVGFPGETEEEFKETLEFLKRIQLTKTHVFKYSKRKGTPAAKMGGQVPENLKDERSKILLALSDANEKSFMENLIGKEFEVLIEETVNGYARGYSENYIPFYIEKEKAVPGEILKAKAVSLYSDGIMGMEI